MTDGFTIGDYVGALDRGELEAKPKHAGGRPKGGFRRDSDWELAEKLFVEGTLVGEGENTKRVYLKRSQIAERTNTTPGAIDQRMMRYGWKEKRDAFMAARDAERLGVPVDAIVTSGTYKNLTPGKRSRRDAEAILESYIDLYADAVAQRKVRFDSIGDLEKAVRLLAFVRGQAESIKQTHTTVSLEIMQARHKAARAYVGGTVDDGVAGVLGRGTPAAVDAEFSEEVEPAREEVKPLEGELVDDDAWAR
jgi:hypothetical protein